MAMYKQRSAYENLTRFNFMSEGKWDIPIIHNDNVKPENFIGFNFAKSCKNPSENCVHFFIDDYQFQRLWNRPDDYINILQKFGCVMSPDFSLYTDFPKAIQIYNHYRKHWLAAYWQMHGIKVIPTICWSDEGSFEWYFDGEPIGGTVAVSSVGTQNNKTAKELFLNGYNEMMKRLEPETVIFYGTIPKECYGNIIRVKAFQEKFREAKIDGR